ncbi:MAG: hypothetical protein JWQ10_3852 [Herbaspirillum sp.]|jgi:hypothetical protein|nr:hypothetical protein [Herbaspirillum sp.]
MTDATGISFGSITAQLGEAAKQADIAFANAMKEVSNLEPGKEVTTDQMIKMQAASQAWAFKLDAVAKAQERLGETFNKIVQKS